MSNPTNPSQNPSENGWYVPHLIVTLADGTFMLRPQKPVQQVVAMRAAKMFSISTRTLARLAESGHIRAAKISPQITLYFPAEIHAFILEMIENPDYWTAKRRREYGMARELKNRKQEGGK